MGKVSGSYASVVLGVSEQVPQDRRSGQHYEQLNMMSDPVKGLARRHGSVLQDEKVIADYNSGLWDALVADTQNHKEFTFFVGGVEYALVYRTKASDVEVQNVSFAWAFNKDTRKLIPIVTDPADTTINLLKAGGVSAAVNVGKYIYLAGNSIVPSYTLTNPYTDPDNKIKLAIWIRGGAYSRTFSVTLTKTDGTELKASYKTKPSSYPELLNTSDILTSDPDYQKKVNDRTNAYNSAVTAYIGEAAADATPENIIFQLKEQLIAQGVQNMTIIGSTLGIDDFNFVEVDGDDGADGTLIRTVGNTVDALDLVSTIHWPGKVVKVSPKKEAGEEVFYLKAIPKNTNATSWTEVTWQEAAGVLMQPTSVFVQGTVKNETLYLASSAAYLTGLTGEDNPLYKPNSVGDEVTTPAPVFFGKRIDYLGIFQDRLVIGSGATVLFSRPGDYFNWFRGSVLTAQDTDPIEIYALGAEDDTITSSTTYDRSLLLCGKRKWYTVNGRVGLTSKNASIVVVAEYEDGQLADPKNSGNFVYYSTSRNNKVSLHQVQTSAFSDNPESINVSQQLDKYLGGLPTQIITVTAPNIVFLRTTTSRYGLYLYTYLDNPAGTERVFDSWNRWEWGEDIGPLVGISSNNGEILAFTIRHSDGQVYIACDTFVTDSSLSSKPYADSLRPVSNDEGFIHPGTGLDAIAAFDNTTEYFLLGSPYAQLTSFLTQYPGVSEDSIWTGISYPAFVTPTNPYVRDQNDKAIVNGRLTLGRLGVSVSDTAGLFCDVETSAGTKRTLSFNGRILGQNINLIGRQPIVTTTVNAFIGKEVRECKYTLSAKTWLPLTITAISWLGQSFNNTRRV